jgi:sugar/nucleoside kinase (ribokinase family)
VGPSASTGAGDNFIGTGAVDIAAGHAYATAEVGVVGKEAGDL